MNWGWLRKLVAWAAPKAADAIAKKLKPKAAPDA